MKSSTSHTIAILALLLNGGLADATPRKEEYANVNSKSKASTIKGTATTQLEDQRDLQYSGGFPRKQPQAQIATAKGNLIIPHEAKWQLTTSWQGALL
eukprot:CAMPEP_0113654042 /NCGR_PEP_ID=MMETSP0017_2-20120614/28939_1 /TAXON_ID=2856 /ORGANISM="Cylindrotheca closterium" /LENGTH=97 /DNA_ID=CAMNT_0000567151 /DNA_START=38 /DNA_END=328 /DNA_ORIENTATION=- /assembly_acc=CAM_ASM_000147